MSRRQEFDRATRLSMADCGRLVLAIASMVFAIAVWFAPAAAGAGPKAVLDSFGTPNGSEGGRLSNSRGLAINQTGNGAPLGSVYVAEGNANHRISQFDKDGNFVRTWGYDVIVATRPDTSVPPNSNGTGFEICDVTNGNVASDCKAGLLGVGAGQLNNPQGISVDQTNGYIYVTSSTNRRIDVFSGTGQFAGAFGWGVDTGALALEFCTTLSVCQATAAAGEAAGNLQSLNASIPAIDPTAAPGTVYVPDVGNGRVSEYATTITAGSLSAVSFVRAFGWDVDPAGGTGLEVCTTTCKKGTSGNGAGQFGPLNTGSPTAAAVDSTGAVYVASGPLVSGNCVEATPCRIQKFSSDLTTAVNFGPSSGPGQLFFGPTAPGTASNTVAALSIAVEPGTDNVFVLRKGDGEGGSTPSTTKYQVHEYESDGDNVDTHPVGAALPAVTNNLGAGLAVGADKRVYANMGGAGAGEVFVLGPVPPCVAVMKPATNITSSSARLDGELTVPAPGGPGFECKYFFEYTDDGETWQRAPLTDQITSNVAGTYPVNVDLKGLSANTFYQARLVATTSETVRSTSISFKTLPAAPGVSLTYTEEVTQTSAELGAHINPGGVKTTYWFEWGPTTAYGHRVPAGAGRQTGGSETLIAKEAITGLSPQTEYHFRLVANNGVSVDDVEGPDQVFETLNECGLADGRCYELVSPADKGPGGAAGDTAAVAQELQFQAADGGSNVAYTIAYGLPDATAGNEVIYQAKRGPTAWTSSQLSAPAVAPPQSTEGGVPSVALGLSRDLACGVYISTQPLTADAPTSPLEAGLANLYRRNADGSWTVLSNREPSHLSSDQPLAAYELIGMSEVAPYLDCNRVVFSTKYQYPGIEGAGETRLYEWEGGALRNVGVVPGPSGPVTVAATAGSVIAGVGRNTWNAVSDDASRVYFTASRQLGDGPAGASEVNKQALFLRENGSTTIDVSQSQTGTPNIGATFQTASVNGDRAFFLANYGLTASSSTGPATCTVVSGVGCDLYEYDLSKAPGSRLANLSADTNSADTQGAGVVGVLGASDDGTSVFFAARGQLVAGQGATEAENLSGNTYSVYLRNASGTEYVGSIHAVGLPRALIRTSASGEWVSRSTPSGKHLLFGSTIDMADYDSGGRFDIYLYSSESNSVACVSCRRDMQPSIAPTNELPIVNGENVENSYMPPRVITEGADGVRVFFISSNPLAYGATAGRPNLFQWRNGQISFVGKSAPSGSNPKFELRFAGASASGDDIYFTSVDHLTWQDFDGKLDLYDARVGGGIAEPPPDPAACDPLLESACQGNAAPGVVAGLAPGSASINGSGNVAPEPKKPKRKKNKGKGKKNKGKDKSGRNANKNGRAGK